MIGRVSDEPARSGPLAEMRVLDLSTVIAGPNCARYLADFGADVIKVERPGGDGLRDMAWKDPRDGVGLWWKLVNRNKRTIVLDLKDPADRTVFLRLVDDADVLVENSRPGTMERIGLGPDVLLARRPSLVMTRVSGFGQTGPYAQRPGFATIAEAMSGFAALNGEPDGAPLLPPIALTDEVTGLAAAFATMVALHSGVGQVVDTNLLETMFHLMGPLASLHAVTGEQQERLGAGLPYTVPRGTYRCRDGGWVAISTSSDSVAARVLELIGRRRRRAIHDVRRPSRASSRTRSRDGALVCRADPPGRARPVRRGRGGDRPGARHGRHRERPALRGTGRHRNRRWHPDAERDRSVVGDARRAALGGPRSRRRRRRDPIDRLVTAGQMLRRRARSDN